MFQVDPLHTEPANPRGSEMQGAGTKIDPGTDQLISLLSASLRTSQHELLQNRYVLSYMVCRSNPSASEV